MDGRTVNGAVLDAPATTPPFATLAAGAGTSAAADAPGIAAGPGALRH